MIANRKFAAAHEGLPVWWHQIGEGGHISLDTTMAYAGKQSLRLEKDKGHIGIGQEQEGLAFQKDRKYVFRKWLKSEANRALRIRISLVRDKDPEVCPRISAGFARAMKETDPSIRMIGVAPSHDPELWPLWHKPLLREAGEYLDLLQHGYYLREAAALGLELAGYFQPVSEGAIKVEPFDCQLEPDGQVFALFGVHQGNRLLELPTIMARDAEIDLCASMSPDKKKVYITLLNHNIENESMVKLSLANIPEPVESSMRLLVPQTLELKEKSFQQFDQKPEVVRGRHVNISLPRCSIALVHLGFPEN
jgi:hypothetical protein